MTRIINEEEAITALQGEVDRRGKDFVYNDEYSVCVYQSDGEPACIAGGALILGLGLSFESPDGGRLEGGIATIRSLLEAGNDVKFTDRAILVLATAQAVQDVGGSHGVALKAASTMSATLAAYPNLSGSDEVTA